MNAIVAERGPAKAVGVDGCGGGWLAAVVDAGGGLALEFHADVAALLAAHADAGRVLIDVPIGLPCAVPRWCDTLARRLLGPRAASVFPVPCRGAVRASSYRRACEVNQRRLGQRLSRQSWNICPATAQVDEWLRVGRRSGWLREAHPEVCFWALAGGRPMAHSKRTPQGVAERLAVLEPWLPAGGLHLHHRPKGGAKRDDLLDALALAVTASFDARRLRTLPPSPQRDARGLAMEIVYGEVFPAERLESPTRLPYYSTDSPEYSGV